MAAVTEIQTIFKAYQESLNHASRNFQAAASDQSKVLTEAKELISETQNHQAAAASKLITSEEYCEKTSRWALGLATAALLFGLYIAVLAAGMVSTLGAIQTERQNLIVELKHVSELQRLAGYRTQLTNERAELEANWKQLQKAANDQGMTPQLEALKTQLETTHANIIRKQKELLTLEKKTYEN